MMVPVEEAKKVLGLDSLQLSSNDFRHVVESINHGALLADCASRSRVRRDFQNLASKICMIEGQSNEKFQG